MKVNFKENQFVSLTCQMNGVKSSVHLNTYFKCVSHILQGSLTFPYFSKTVFILMQSTHTLIFGLCYTTECRIVHGYQGACETCGNALPVRIYQDHIFTLLHHWNLPPSANYFWWVYDFNDAQIDVQIKIIPNRFQIDSQRRLSFTVYWFWKSFWLHGTWISL